MWFRLVARAKSVPLPLVDEKIAVPLWVVLMRNFPKTATALLTPNRLEFVARGSSVRKVRAQLSQLLAELPLLTGKGVPLPEWEPIELPRALADFKEIYRHVNELIDEALQMAASEPSPQGLVYIPDEIIADMQPLMSEDDPILVPIWHDMGFTDPTVN